MYILMVLNPTFLQDQMDGWMDIFASVFPPCKIVFPRNYLNYVLIHFSFLSHFLGYLSALTFCISYYNVLHCTSKISGGVTYLQCL